MVPCPPGARLAKTGDNRVPLGDHSVPLGFYFAKRPVNKEMEKIFDFESKL
jgi:hypothetical protein